MADTSTAATSQSSTGQATDQPAVAAAQPAAAASTPTQTSQTSSATTAPTRPSGLPDSFWDAATGIKPEFWSHYTENATKLAAEEIRRNTLPKTAAEVKVELPKDFKLPEGFDWKFNSEAPEYKWLQETAVQEGWTQDQVTKLVGKYAEMQVGSQASYEAAKKAELDKLGANATPRVTAIDTWVRGTFGEDVAKHIRSAMYSAGVVESLEKIVARFGNQGAASFSQAHREPGGQTGRVSEEAYAKMSAAERWDYARGFDQKQFQNGAR